MIGGRPPIQMMTRIVVARIVMTRTVKKETVGVGAIYPDSNPSMGQVPLFKLPGCK